MPRPIFLDTDKHELYCLAFVANKFFDNCIGGEQYSAEEQDRTYHAIKARAKNLERMILSEEEIQRRYGPCKENFFYHYVSIVLIRILCNELLDATYTTDEKNDLYDRIVQLFSSPSIVYSESPGLIVDPTLLNHEQAKSEGVELARSYFAELFIIWERYQEEKRYNTTIQKAAYDGDTEENFRPTRR